jgi:hypothetical protein
MTLDLTAVRRELEQLDRGIGQSIYVLHDRAMALARTLADELERERERCNALDETLDLMLAREGRIGDELDRLTAANAKLREENTGLREVLKIVLNDWDHAVEGLRNTVPREESHD